jgi:hypothetical protein
MPIEPLVGKPARIPPRRVEVRLNAEHERAYRTLYARYRTIIDGLPALRHRDFDGRAVKMPQHKLEALNRAFARLGESGGHPSGVFDVQESEKERRHKRLQYLS